jgi:hypothetical protein
MQTLVTSTPRADAALVVAELPVCAALDDGATERTRPPLGRPLALGSVVVGEVRRAVFGGGHLAPDRLVEFLAKFLGCPNALNRDVGDASVVADGVGLATAVEGIGVALHVLLLNPCNARLHTCNGIVNT